MQETTQQRYRRLQERNDRALAHAAEYYVKYALRRGVRPTPERPVPSVPRSLLFLQDVQAYADRLEIDAVLREVTA